jgi:hypothetical protein
LEVKKVVDEATTKPSGEEYHAFMLRLIKRRSKQRWYMTLEDPYSHERRTFKNVELLVVYLLTLIGQEEFNLDRHQRVRRKEK